jgi:hypothetical protein
MIVVMIGEVAAIPKVTAVEVEIIIFSHDLTGNQHFIA